MSNSRADGRPGAKKIPAELPASRRPLAGAVLIFAEPPAAARRGRRACQRPAAGHCFRQVTGAIQKQCRQP
jgi:methylphosphotriester-DNA--protein-cysteine methyltransferase